MKKVLITGGAGFFGSNLVRFLDSHYPGIEVLIIDNFSSGSKDLVGQVQNVKLQYIEADLKNRQSYQDFFFGVDYVFHLAANPDIAAAANDPSIDFWEGTLLTQNVLDSMRLNSCTNLFYSSGSGVYGEKLIDSFPENYGEKWPVSPYGASKLACEAMVSAYSHMYGIRSTIFRLANIVGPNQTHGVAFDFINKLLASNGCSLKVLGDGSQLKSYIHISDVLAAINKFCFDYPLRQSIDVFNISSMDRVSVSEIAEIVIRCMGLDVRKVDLVFGLGSRGWLGDVPIIGLDPSKALEAGWSPVLTSRQAIEKSVFEMLEKRVTDDFLF